MFGVSKPICPEASLTHDGTRLLHQRSKRSGKQRVSRKAAAPWSRGCCRSGVFALDILSSRYSIGLPGGGAYAPHKCFAASKTLRRGNLFTPSIQIPRTGGRLRRPEPKKKDMTCGHVFLFCKGRLRSIFSRNKTKTPQSGGLRALAPEASESTNSTTRANGEVEQLYCSVQALYYHIRERVSSFFCGILSFSFLPL